MTLSLTGGLSLLHCSHLVAPHAKEGEEGSVRCWIGLAFVLGMECDDGGQNYPKISEIIGIFCACKVGKEGPKRVYQRDFWAPLKVGLKGAEIGPP